jgi:hypothetical protein
MHKTEPVFKYQNLKEWLLFLNYELGLICWKFYDPVILLKGVSIALNQGMRWQLHHNVLKPLCSHIMPVNGEKRQF